MWWIHQATLISAGKLKGVCVSLESEGRPRSLCANCILFSPSRAQTLTFFFSNRVLGMVDGAVLLVDATEGPLSQTKFVVEKALRQGLKPMVVLNKVDRPSATPARCGEVESAAFDAFAALGADDEQLDFPVLYASARQGWASRSLPAVEDMPAPDGMAPLLDALVDHVPPPTDRTQEPFSFLVVLTERDPYLGRVSTGRIASGGIRLGDTIKVIKHTGEQQSGFKVTKLFKRQGTRTLELERAVAGDIVSIAGAPAAGVADTICDTSVSEGLPPGQVDPPTLSMIFSPNSSPLAGREGAQLTASKIGDRLRAEAETNVSLRVLAVEGGGGEAFEVQARGELQLGLLIGVVGIYVCVYTYIHIYIDRDVYCCCCALIPFVVSWVYSPIRLIRLPLHLQKTCAGRGLSCRFPRHVSSCARRMESNWSRWRRSSVRSWMSMLVR